MLQIAELPEQERPLLGLVVPDLLLLIQLAHQRLAKLAQHVVVVVQFLAAPQQVSILDDNLLLGVVKVAQRQVGLLAPAGAVAEVLVQ